MAYYFNDFFTKYDDFLQFVIHMVNTSYLTDSSIIFTLKMKSGSKNTIFGQKIMVKSGLEKFLLKFLNVGR